MLKKISFILPLSLVCFLGCCIAQTEIKSLSVFVQDNADSICKKEKLPGIFICVLNNDERSYYNAGFANPDKQMPFDSATFFEIGSITKTFTAYVLTAVLMENKIAETAKVINYLPDSVKQNINLGNISFLSLMNHTSGLPRLPDNMKPSNEMQPYESYSLDNLFSYLKNCTPKPDGKSNYSNLGAGLAGVLAEQISGKSYGALLDQYIFVPFKIVAPVNAIALTENKSQGYFSKDDKTGYWNMNVLAPAGGLKCNGSEMLTYLQNMCFPKTGGSKIIVDQLTNQTVSMNPKTGIGKGWHIFNDNNQPLFYWHNGGTYGFSTFCAFTKDKSKAVVVVVNQFNKNAIVDGLGVKIIKKLISEE
ncbi:MAG: beta-lactamase family protein [Ferruginibacter sp.]|nr:beta-lactamase family protein [Ferruginibacter sp.]